MLNGKMDNAGHIRFNAEDRSYFAILKKQIHHLVAEAGFSIIKAAEIDIVVAEITSNLIKHAGGGELLVRIVDDGDNNQCIELISIDNGPGITDPLKMIADGMSTSNTLGHGLGAIKRMSDVFQLYSLKDWGTILLSRIYKKKPLTHNNSLKEVAEIRSVVVAKPGEIVSGDGAYYSIGRDYIKLFLGDGLGHGPDAHIAVQKAIATLSTCNENTPVEILRFLNTEVKRTRGLVGSLAMYYFKEKKWRICGIGNISTHTHNVLGTKNYMSYNGIIGMNIPNTLKEQEIANERGQTVIMCSDGIKTRWDVQKYVGIFKYDLSILAAAIYKDFARRTDDMSVLVCRINSIT